MNREEFYQLRDQRTFEYGIREPFENPVGIVVSEAAAETVGGQVCTLGLVNMAARLHRRLRLVVPAVPLLVPSWIGGDSLESEVSATVTSIDPFNDCVVRPDLAELEIPAAAIGVGAVSDVPLCIGAEGFAGWIIAGPALFASAPSTIIGGAVGACLGAAALCQIALDRHPGERRVSMWAMDDSTQPGASESLAPIDVGSVAVIGAGAVASALAYWLRYVGSRGNWQFVDHDQAELHNTNRGLGLRAADAGWTGRDLSGERAFKAATTAALVGAASYTGWYDDWVRKEAAYPDLVLPLANGPGLRNAIGQRGEAVLLHATTSRIWTAELHRHLASRDGCIACRLPETLTPQLSCSTSPLPDAQASNDAALPFLSGSAGLMLLTGLVHLADGRLADFGPNQWVWHLDLPDRVIRGRTWSCESGCGVMRNMPRDLRRRLPRGQRWTYLD